MATTPPKIPRRGATAPKGAAGAAEALERAEAAGRDTLAALGADSAPSAEDRETVRAGMAQVSELIKRVAGRQNQGANSTLETMARLTQDSLLRTPVPTSAGGVASAARNIQVTDQGQTLINALKEVEGASVNEIMLNEKGRTDDYLTFSQIYDLITQASEAVQTYADNIISPDDFTKRDITAMLEGAEVDEELRAEFERRARELIEKYRLEDRVEEAIVRSLTKGDYFIAVLNLRQEIETLLSEAAQPGVRDAADMELSEAHLPAIEDPLMEALGEILTEDSTKPVKIDGKARSDLAEFLKANIHVSSDVGRLVQSDNKANDELIDSIKRRQLRDLNRVAKDGKVGGLTLDQAADKRARSLAGSSVTGSVIKMIQPENVIKLYQGDTLFGYFYIELHGPDLSDFARRASMDQTTVVRAIDQALSARALSTWGANGPERGKEAIIGRLIVRTLASRLGNAETIAKNEGLAADAYAILSRARRENKRVTFTFIAPDQMVHFTPNGAPGYGDSVLSRVKFLAKLYIGAMTNAFMRNSIRRPERLVWYVDIGADNDGTNAIQNFIRTIKQREVKFSDLKTITTTINQIGEFHDFYIPTYSGERPVEVETLNMGGASEVDSPYLEYLRKAIIGGMGVPAAFVGYSEEVAFARSLTMDNGRFLRRVVRHQKHYGRAATQLFRALWVNEYTKLEDIVGDGVTDATPIGSKERAGGEEAAQARAARKEAEASGTNPIARVDVSKIFVRYPSPATLNMTNLSDSINQAQPVVEFIADNVGVGEEDDVRNELKKRILQDMLPQIHWTRYAEMLIESKREIARRKAAKPAETPPADGGGSGGGDAGGSETF